jgi:hypothetical protein
VTDRFHGPLRVGARNRDMSLKYTRSPTAVGLLVDVPRVGRRWEGGAPEGGAI